MYKQFEIIPICFKQTFQTRGVHIPNCRSARSVQNCRVQLTIINHFTNWLFWLMNQFYSRSAEKCRIQLTVSPVCRSQGLPQSKSPSWWIYGLINGGKQVISSESCRKFWRRRGHYEIFSIFWEQWSLGNSPDRVSCVWNSATKLRLIRRCGGTSLPDNTKFYKFVAGF